MKRIISLVMALVLLIGVGIHGQGAISDVAENHWAKEYIDRVLEEGIMTLDGSNNFNPDTNMTRVTALLTIARLLGIDEDKDGINRATSQYGALVDGIGVPAWAREGISYVLYKGIIKDVEVLTLMDRDKRLLDASRSDVIVYLVKALRLDGDLQDQVVLPFADSTSVDIRVRPYVFELYDKGIISGDSNNRINPNRIVTRAEMAKMIIESLDYLATVEPELPKVEEVITGDMIGAIINNVLTVGDRTVIMITDDKGIQGLYDLLPSTSLEKDGKKVAIGELAVGARVDVSISNGKLTKLVIRPSSETVRGVVTNIYVFTGNVLAFRLEDDTLRVLEVSKNALIKMNDEIKSFDFIKAGDRVEVEIYDNIITSIKGESKVKYVLGTLVELKFEDYLYIVLKDSFGEISRYLVAEDITVIKDTKASNIYSLRKGNDISLKTEDRLGTLITAKSKEHTYEGRIEEIRITANPLIIISTADGIKELSLSPSIDILSGNSKLSMHDLRVGTNLLIKAEDLEIVSISVKGSPKEETLTGKVGFVSQGQKFFTVTADGTNFQRVVLATGATISYKGTSIKAFADIKKGAKIVISGVMDMGIFKANTIIIMYYE